MNETHGEFPVVECPHCNKEFQVDDYYEMGEGDEFDCRHCEKTIYVKYAETVIQVCLSTQPPNT